MIQILRQPIFIYIVFFLLFVIIIFFPKILSVIDLTTSNYKSIENLKVINDTLELEVIQTQFKGTRVGFGSKRAIIPYTRTFYISGLKIDETAYIPYTYYPNSNPVYQSNGFFIAVDHPTAYKRDVKIYFTDGTDLDFISPIHSGSSHSSKSFHNKEITKIRWGSLPQIPDKEIEKIVVNFEASKSRDYDYTFIFKNPNNKIYKTGSVIFNDILLDNNGKSPTDFSYCLISSNNFKYKENILISLDQNIYEINKPFKNPNLLSNYNKFENLKITLQRLDDTTSPIISNLEISCSKNENDLKQNDKGSSNDKQEIFKQDITLSTYSADFGNGRSFITNFKNSFSFIFEFFKRFFVDGDIK